MAYEDFVWPAWIVMLIVAVVLGIAGFFADDTATVRYTDAELRRCQRTIDNLTPGSDAFRRCATVLGTFEEEAADWATGANR